MSKNTKFKVISRIPKIKRFVVGFLAVIYFALLCFLTISGRNSVDVATGKNFSVQGVASAAQIFISIAMTVVEYSVGGIVALVLLVLSFLSNTMAIIHGNYAALPGSIYYIAGILSIFAIRSGMYNTIKLASIDSLTKVRNRRSILDYIARLIEKNTPFYLLYLGLDHFKYINDTDGHEKGDEVLIDIVNEWQKICDKDSDIGRLGGDEFLVVIPKNKCKDIEETAQQYLLALEKWKAEKNMPVYLTASIGISNYPDNGKDVVSKADLALVSAKNAGRNRYCVYNKDFGDEIVKQGNVEVRIVDALKNDKFYMVYQPQFNTKTKTVRGFEALIRMDAGDDEPIYPGDFIPVAEKSDLILDIGKFVLSRVTADFSDVILEHPDIVVSINVSAKQLLSTLFIDQLKNALTKNFFPPENLEIEITEYCMLDATEDVIEVIKKVKDLGIKIAMDDFGTGYSSLSYLTKFPIDLIKIDKSIVDTMNDGVIIQAIVSMGHALNCEIISEGVEEEDQIGVLETRDCDYIQGYVWGRPLSLEDAKALLNK